MRKQWMIFAVTTAALVGLPTAAFSQAVGFDFAGDAPLTPTPAASLIGNVSYDASISRLIFDITNTSPGDVLSLTGFMFNGPYDVGVSFIDPDPEAGQGFAGIADVYVEPYGTFVTGAALGGEFFSGGDPFNGLFPLEQGTFQFNVTIKGAPAGDAVSAADFLSIPAEEGMVQAFFVARFREDGGDGTQLVPVLASVTPPPIPLPAAAWSALSGLAMLAVPAVRRRMCQPA